MFCLHYVLLPRVKRAVTEFAHAQNYHALRTEGNLTPLQLLQLNSHLMQLHRPIVISLPDGNYLESHRNLSVVEVPRTACPLTDLEFNDIVSNKSILCLTFH